MKPVIVIFDLDNTLIKTDRRYTHESIYPSTLSLLHAHQAQEHRIHFYTARSERLRLSTMALLARYAIQYDRLYMRPKGDNNRAFQLKYSWLDFNNYQYIAAYDDDPLTVAMFKHQGINALLVKHP